MFPMIGGHEGSGVVVEVGEGVTEFAPGDHVVTSFVAVCGQCRWCNSGMEYICDMGAQVMIPGMPTDGTFRHHTADGRQLGHLSKVGAFSKHTVVSTDSIIKIDPHLPLLPMALLSCADSDRLRLGGEPRQGTHRRHGRRHRRRAASAPRRSRARASTAPRRSSRWIRSSSSRSPRFGIRCHPQRRRPPTEAADLVRDLTRGVMADSVVVSPSLISGEDVQAALSLTRKGGTCVLTGMTKQTTSSIAINLQEFILWNKNIVGTVFGSCNPRVDVPRFARLYEAGPAATRRDDHQALPPR